MSMLPDVHSVSDSRSVYLSKVGVSRVRQRLAFCFPGARLEDWRMKQTNGAELDMFVSLDAEQRGVHMSRFIRVASNLAVSLDFPSGLSRFLNALMSELESKDSFVKISSDFFVTKKAPVSGEIAFMPYRFELQAEASRQSLGVDTVGALVESGSLSLTVPVATLCPCSKSLCQVSAHNQRANISVKVQFSSLEDLANFDISDLVLLIESSASSAVFPALKRVDEKYVTELQYSNPRFVEDVSRELILALSKLSVIRSFDIDVESLESIHPHNARVLHSFMALKS